MYVILVRDSIDYESDEVIIHYDLFDTNDAAHHRAERLCGEACRHAIKDDLVADPSEVEFVLDDPETASVEGIGWMRSCEIWEVGK